MLITILVFLVILTVLVLIHELGHFLVAKKFGIKVEEFGFGFPPRVWGKKIGETLYSINALPIGGFVKLYGEDEAGGGKLSLPVSSSKYKVSSKKNIPDTKYLIHNTDLDRAFFARPIWQRALVVVAGVVMNFLLAVAIVTYLFTFEGVPTPGDKIIISEVIKGSPAQIAGLMKGDFVEKIGSVKVKDSQTLINETKKHLGEPIKLTIKNEKLKETKKVIVVPRKNYPEGQGPMGVAISQNIIVQKYPFPRSLYYGTRQTIDDSILTVVGFKKVLIDIFTKFTIPQGVAGPIGMAQITGEFVKVGPSAVLSLMYILSLSLAVLNILPVPALDGGRFFFILIEALTRRKVNARFESYAHAVGIILLLAFMALVSYKDILRIISGQSILPQ